MWEYVALLLAAAYLSSTPPVQAIVGGHDSNITREPYVVSLQSEGSHICGGAIIQQGGANLEWVLTSAQCVSNIKELSVRAYSSEVSSGGGVYSVGEVYIHPDYNPRNYDSDIALLKLSEPVPHDPVFGISLPYLDDEIKEDTSITITGWGKTSSVGDFPETLQMVQVPYRTLEQCRSSYSENSITDNMFCAGYLSVGNVTSCTGDYGGAGTTTGWLVGIQSWGKSCGLPQYPTVFTKVINFVPWIVDITGIPVPPSNALPFVDEFLDYSY